MHAPDDGAVNLNELDLMMTKFEASPNFIEDKAFQFYDSSTSAVKKVTRQNVILEFGYFMGLLGRDRVCCLHKGDVELPSDMHGIVYVPFKESVNEVRDKIIKELRAVDYEIEMLTSIECLKCGTPLKPEMEKCPKCGSGNRRVTVADSGEHINTKLKMK